MKDGQHYYQALTKLWMRAFGAWHVMLCYVMLCYFMLCCVTLCCYVMSYCVRLCYMLSYVMLCYVNYCFALLLHCLRADLLSCDLNALTKMAHRCVIREGVSCNSRYFIMLCYMLYYMLCYVMLLLCSIIALLES